ncbi:S8 family peptidase [Noviherbaspirillum galbum]|uniref:S8 family serine peptidase n=1 Tax=Noviherbaspirillum galbum TaxID=2709383 RepID=A0A6B3SVI1_9BURK|nr:S8 family serine peptidase [Noviherbaspirillum galbum]NEX64757.1 S8 family serine peptidase [Noviherbaspirillum galbum]
MLHLPAPHFRPDASYAGGYDNASHAARRQIAQQLAEKNGLELTRDWPMPALGLDCYVMRVPGDHDPEAMARQLSSDPRVEWAQVMHYFDGLGHNDPMFPAQPAAHAWQLDRLHLVTTGRQVTVAVIDSGVDTEHPDLRGQIAHSRNFIENTTYPAEQHGTAVAGIIAAVADNGIGIAGIAPQARLLALRACRETADRATLCDSLSLAKALDFAIQHRAEIINMSLSGPSDRLLGMYVDLAASRGITVVAAFDERRDAGGFPASNPFVFATAAERDAPAAPFHAPGRDVPATAPGAQWKLVSGSSFAAAHLSGMVALVRQLRPAVPQQELWARLRGAAATPVADAANSSRMDACAVISWAGGTCTCSCEPAQAGITHAAW